MIFGPKKPVSVCLTVPQYELLKQLARESNRSISAYVRMVLNIYLYHALTTGKVEGNDWLNNI